MTPREVPSPALADVRRRVSRRIAGAYFLCATAWILISDLALFELTKDLPSLTAVSLIKGGAFVLVTTALLYLLISNQLRSQETGGRAPGAEVLPLAGMRPVALFGFIAVAAIVLVAVMFAHESGVRRELAREDLRAILELKATQIEMQLSQREAMARSYGRSRSLRREMAQIAQGASPAIAAGVQKRIEELRQDLRFDAVLVFDRSGQRIAGAGADGLLRLSDELAVEIARAMASGKPVAHFLHRDTGVCPAVPS